MWWSNANARAVDPNSEEESSQVSIETETLLLTAVSAKPTIWVVAYNGQKLFVFWLLGLFMCTGCLSRIIQRFITGGNWVTRVLNWFGKDGIAIVLALGVVIPIYELIKGKKVAIEGLALMLLKWAIVVTVVGILYVHYVGSWCTRSMNIVLAFDYYWICKAIPYDHGFSLFTENVIVNM